MEYSQNGIQFPNIEQIANSISIPRQGEKTPTHPIDTILFHGSSYNIEEFKKQILAKTNIGRLYAAEYYGQLVHLVNESETC